MSKGIPDQSGNPRGGLNVGVWRLKSVRHRVLEGLVNLKNQDVGGGVFKNAARQFFLFFGKLEFFVVAEMLTCSEVLR